MTAWSKLARKVRQAGIRTFGDRDEVTGERIPVEYRPKSGGSFDLHGVFTDGHQAVDVGAESPISSAQIWIGIDLDELDERAPGLILIGESQGVRTYDSTMLIGDTLMRGGVEYAVIEAKPEGEGGAELQLHKV